MFKIDKICKNEDRWSFRIIKDVGLRGRGREGLGQGIHFLEVINQDR